MNWIEDKQMSDREIVNLKTKMSMEKKLYLLTILSIWNPILYNFLKYKIFWTWENKDVDRIIQEQFDEIMYETRN